MAIKVNAGYDISNGNTIETVVLELVKAHARSCVSGVTNLTDSSGGTASGTNTLVAASTSLTNTANSGTNLAQKASTETALSAAKDALLELATKANEYATKLGITGLTWNGGGTAADGTIGSIGVSVTAASTGAKATETNAIFGAINVATYKLGTLVNKLAIATGKTPLVLTALRTTFTSTVSTLSTDTGTAADPGLTKAAVDAELAKVRNNVATIAAKLNELNDGLGNAAVVAV